MNSVNPYNAASGMSIESFAYSYDALGRLVSRNADTFGYNDRSEVVYSRRDAENAEEIYGYDCIGNLLSNVCDSATNIYTANNLNQYSYVHATSASSAFSAGDISPSYDLDGNISHYLNANGNTVAQYSYDAFGRTVSQSGSLANIFRHRFSSKYFDPETGLYYYGYRFYSPSLMRWLNRDPIEEAGGLNLYGFCLNSTAMYYDFRGAVIPMLLPAGLVVAETAAELALVAIATAIIIAIADNLPRLNCKRCRPCDPPVGTLMYQIHTTHSHAGMKPHIHYFSVQQSPYEAGCGCFAPRHHVAEGDIPTPGSIPYRKPIGGGNE